MAIQRHIFQPPARARLPDEFLGQIVRFREATGLIRRALACLLGFRPYHLRQWRCGQTIPSAGYLFPLLTIAECKGLCVGS